MVGRPSGQKKLRLRWPCSFAESTLHRATPGISYGASPTAPSKILIRQNDATLKIGSALTSTKSAHALSLVTCAVLGVVHNAQSTSPLVASLKHNIQFLPLLRHRVLRRRAPNTCRNSGNATSNERHFRVCSFEVSTPVSRRVPPILHHTSLRSSHHVLLSAITCPCDTLQLDTQSDATHTFQYRPIPTSVRLACDLMIQSLFLQSSNQRSNARHTHRGVLCRQRTSATWFLYSCF